MGVASYREDDLNRYFEATDAPLDFGATRPPMLHCPFCLESFENRRALSDHLSSKHHGDRPVLLIRGHEPDGFSTIHQRLLPDQIVIENCTEVRLRLNGLDRPRVGPLDAARLLSSLTDAEVDLELVNRFDAVAESAKETYRVRVRIADKAAIDVVDRAFIKQLAVGQPLMSDVANFLNDPHCVGVVRDYADALGAYVRGLLVKDQAIGTGVTLRPAEADDLYRSALAVLENVRRPLPIVICGLVRFAVNDFSLADQSTGFARLDRCNASFASLLGVHVEAYTGRLDRGGGGTVNLCPIDHSTDRILDLGNRLSRHTRWGPTVRDDCRQAAEGTTLTEHDRVKIHALWATHALRLGVPDAAREPLRRLRNSYPFNKWAIEQLDRMEV